VIPYGRSSLCSPHPFRIWKPLLGLLFLLVIVLFVVGFGGRFALERIGFRVGSVPVLLLDLVTLLVLLALAFRFLTNPLIIHFGDMDGETHGSARFATDKETAALGHLAPVERAMGLMAGYGVQLWPILQDVHQLRATYGQRAGTFLSNAGVLQVFGVNDHDSARLVSDLLGQETVVFQTMSRALDSDKSGISYGEQHTARPLLPPDEVRNLPQHVELLFLAGQRPIVAGKLAYYADTEFRGLFDQT
jgi:type IV secretory pathway TraG/TraD family ATPase VirD4